MVPTGPVLSLKFVVDESETGGGCESCFDTEIGKPVSRVEQQFEKKGLGVDG